MLKEQKKDELFIPAKKEELLPGLTLYNPGQNSFNPGSLIHWSSDGSHPYDRLLRVVKDTLGSEADKPWVKPVLVFGVTVALFGALIYYTRRKPGAHMALSMGEMSSLVQSGKVPADQMTEIMIERARLTSHPSDPETGLVAVTGLAVEEIARRVKQAQIDGKKIELANINTPTQGVIGGWIKDLKEASSYFPDAKRYLSIEGVNRAFHTSFMGDVVAPFIDCVKGLLSVGAIRETASRVYSPMNHVAGRGMLLETAEAIDLTIKGQLDTPVNKPPVWRELLERENDGRGNTILVLDASGISAGLVKANVDKEDRVMVISDPPSLRAALMELAKIYPGELSHLPEVIRTDEVLNG